MEHIVFLYNCLAVFLTISAMTILSFQLFNNEYKVKTVMRLFLLFSFLCVTLPHTLQVYFFNITQSVHQIFTTIQEYGIILVSISLVLYVNYFTNYAWKRNINIIICVSAVFNSLIFVFGNYIDVKYWPFCFTVYAGTLVAAIVYLIVMGLFLNKFNTKHVRDEFRIVSIISIALLPVFILIDLFGGLIHIFELDYIHGILAAFIPPSVWSVFFIYEAFTKNTPHEQRENINRKSDILAASSGLTNREKEVLPMLIRGASYEEIGDILCISKTTVKSHVQNIYNKTGAANRNKLVYLVLHTEPEHTTDY